MPANLSVKNVPDELMERLRQLAARHHRSLQGELMAIIEESVRSNEHLTPEMLLAQVRSLGLRTVSESVEMIRSDRDAR